MIIDSSNISWFAQGYWGFYTSDVELDDVISVRFPGQEPVAFRLMKTNADSSSIVYREVIRMWQWPSHRKIFVKINK